MKKAIFLLSFLLGLVNLQAQTLVDSVKKAGETIYFLDGIEKDNIFYTSIFKENNTGRYLNNINIYDQSLNLIDSIDGSQTGRRNLDVAVFGFFKLNHKKYVYSRDLQFRVNVFRLVGNTLSDSAKIDLDTITRSLPVITKQVNPNLLRVVLYEQSQNTRFYIKSKIIDLDSNFNIIDYHAFDFNQTNLAPQAQSQLITGVFEVSNTSWHIHTNRALHFYNPQNRTIDSSQYLFGETRAFLRVNQNEYLAMGTVSFSQPILGLPYTGMYALGFYRVKNNGAIVDTSWFLNVDNNSQGTLDFSQEVMNTRSIVAMDSSSIYLSSVSLYSKNSASKPEYYLFIVKTNSRGKEKWRYRWGGHFKVSTIGGLIQTPDNGCLLMGSYAYDYPRVDSTAGILIKLGPDGNISNVELDAPETVVSFYPNPIKDKLHYSFLPEANHAYFLEILDMQGKPVLTKALEDEKGFILVNLQTGFYLYHLKDADGKVQQIGKIVAE